MNNCAYQDCNLQKCCNHNNLRMAINWQISFSTDEVWKTMAFSYSETPNEMSRRQKFIPSCLICHYRKTKGDDGRRL